MGDRGFRGMRTEVISEKLSPSAPEALSDNASNL